MKPKTLLAPIAILLFCTQPAVAAAPNIQTPTPVIYLADNLDEVDDLGWCIDTLGRGFAETLQAHSCKPQGGDVQFSLDTASGSIQSVEFPGKCMVSLIDAEQAFGLVDCDPDAAAQRFAYDMQTQAITLADDPTQCLTVGEESRAAGPFMSRDLLKAACDNTAPIYRTWIVAP